MLIPAALSLLGLPVTETFLEDVLLFSPSPTDFMNVLFPARSCLSSGPRSLLPATAQYIYLINELYN